nr:putative ribonuclease H-like domain-containing protein [Tanacetum cinerariifolium]
MMTHRHSNRNVVPTIVLSRSRLVSLNAARPIPTAVPQSTVKNPRPVKHVVNKAYSPIRRPINYKPATKNSNFNKKVTTVKVNKVNVVQGTNDFKEFNGGYVAFGGNPKGGKISSKDTDCVVLSSDYMLPDENHVLLRVPRENNMYNVYLKNIVPLGDLTCLLVKATLDESNLWHRTLGHINFKTMNKMVKGNLVRGLPSNIFENNHTCVACQKGKQHKAFVNTPRWFSWYQFDEKDGIGVTAADLKLMLLGILLLLSQVNVVEGFTLMVNLTIYVLCIKQFWAMTTIKKVIVTEDVIRRDLHLDDADGVECFLNEEILAELARMGYEKPPPKLTFLQGVLLCTMENVFANLRRVRKGFSGVETPLFASMLIQPLPQAAKEEEVEVPTAPALPSPNNAPSLPLQDPIPT